MFIVRRARHSDALGIITAHVRSIREICSRDYTSAQIAGWSGRKFRSELWCQVMDRDLVWVVEHQGEVQGFCHLALLDTESAEVMGLYLAPEVCGLGAGGELLRVMRTRAEEEGIARLRLYSTLTALGFYQRFGFKKTQEQLTIELGGVPIPCYPMECQLPIVRKTGGRI